MTEKSWALVGYMLALVLLHAGIYLAVARIRKRKRQQQESVSPPLPVPQADESAE